MERRPLGQTGEQLSVVGMGGIVVMGASPEDASRFVAEAVDRGVNYFDVAPSYGDAEERLGPALDAPERGLPCVRPENETGPGARQELETSLERLRTDHVDLYQLHALTSMEDVEVAFGPCGRDGNLLQARQEGKSGSWGSAPIPLKPRWSRPGAPLPEDPTVTRSQLLRRVAGRTGESAPHLCAASASTPRAGRRARPTRPTSAWSWTARSAAGRWPTRGPPPAARSLAECADPACDVYSDFDPAEVYAARP